MDDEYLNGELVIMCPRCRTTIQPYKMEKHINTHYRKDLTHREKADRFREMTCPVCNAPSMFPQPPTKVVYNKTEIHMSDKQIQKLSEYITSSLIDNESGFWDGQRKMINRVTGEWKNHISSVFSAFVKKIDDWPTMLKQQIMDDVVELMETKEEFKKHVSIQNEAAKDSI